MARLKSGADCLVFCWGLERKGVCIMNGRKDFKKDSRKKDKKFVRAARRAKAVARWMMFAAQVKVAA